MTGSEIEATVLMWRAAHKEVRRLEAAESALDEQKQALAKARREAWNEVYRLQGLLVEDPA